MGKEIERKYLVKDDSYIRMAEKCLSLAQGYLSRDPLRTVRVRLCDDKAFLTVKGKTIGATRDEFEYEIPFADGERLLEMCEGRVIRKKRYVVNFGDFIWEVDRYEADLSPLVTAEVELPTEETVFELPGFVGKEVTGNPKYYNSNL